MNPDEIASIFRDTRLVELSIDFASKKVSLSIERFRGNALETRNLELIGVTEISIFEEFGSQWIENVKVIQSCNCLYISLDPYDETHAEDQRDNQTFRASLCKFSPDTTEMAEQG